MNGKSLALWSLTLLLVVVFAAAGYAKVTGAPQMVDNFQRFGYSDSFRLLVGAGEVAAAVLLLFPRSAGAAAWLLVCIMFGAMGTHLTRHEYLAASAPIVLGLLCLVVALARRPANFQKGRLNSRLELERLLDRDRQVQIRGGR